MALGNVISNDWCLPQGLSRGLTRALYRHHADGEDRVPAWRAEEDAGRPASPVGEQAEEGPFYTLSSVHMHICA